MPDIKKYEPLWGAWYVESLIGRGAFSKVYKVRREAFGKTHYAAVKIIPVPQDESDLQLMRREGLDEASVRGFFHAFAKDIISEIDLISQFRGNSHVVSIEDYQIIEEQTDTIGWDILIRMELLTSLADHIEEIPLSEEETIKLGIHMCQALELCALKNIIHRDIKPGNIFISQYGDYKLGDFGIARQVERTGSELSKKGTITYMAPEVFKEEPYGASVDIYSLGIVLYSLLNRNRTPFLPDYPQPILPADRDRALHKRMSGETAPALQTLSPDLNKLILKACAYNPKERYAGPAEMREALEHLTIDNGGCRSGAAQRMVPFAQTGGVSWPDHSEEKQTLEEEEAAADSPVDDCQSPWWEPKMRPIPFQPGIYQPVPSGDQVSRRDTGEGESNVRADSQDSSDEPFDTESWGDAEAATKVKAEASARMGAPAKTETPVRTATPAKKDRIDRRVANPTTRVPQQQAIDQQQRMLITVFLAALKKNRTAIISIGLGVLAAAAIVITVMLAANRTERAPIIGEISEPIIPEISYDEYTVFFSETFKGGEFTRDWAVMNGEAEVRKGPEDALKKPAGLVWDSEPVFEDAFSGGAVDASKWGNAADGSIDNGRMKIAEGRLYINRPPVTVYAIEFDLEKSDQHPEIQDSWFMLQFIAPEALNEGNWDYAQALLFRRNGSGVKRVDRGPAGEQIEIAIGASTRTEVGDPPLSVRVEIVGGYVTVYTKSSDGHYVQEGERFFAEVLKNPMHVGFFRYNVTGYINNVKLYQPLPLLVMEDSFNRKDGANPDNTKWYNGEFGVVEGGRMRVGSDFLCLKKALAGFVLEFDLALTEDADADSWIKVQFRGADNRDTGNDRPALTFHADGISFYDPDPPTRSVLLSGLGLKAGDPPLSVRVEIFGGALTVYTKFSEEEFEERGTVKAEILRDRFFFSCFSSQGVGAYLDNVKLYREPPPEANYALRFTEDSRLTADALKPTATKGEMAIHFRLSNLGDGKEGGVCLVDDQGAGYGFRLTAGPGNAGQLTLTKTEEYGAAEEIIRDCSAETCGPGAWESVSVLWNTGDKTFEMYVNGAQVGAGQDVDYTSFTKIVVFGSAGVYMDDIRVDSVPVDTEL